MLRFGDFELDEPARELRHAGERVPLRPKVFDVLRHLVAHRARVVSRDELLEAVWPDRYVSESTLSACIKELRRQLDDSGDAQRIIRTARGAGFRFVADIDGHESAAGGGAAGSSTPVSVLCCRASTRGDAGRAAAQAAAQRHEGRWRATQAPPMDCIVFGAPLVYEDHARRALLAAAEIVRDLPTARVAVVHGEASDGEAAATALIATASTLLMRVKPGDTLIDAATHALVQAEAETTVVDGQPEAWRVRGIESHSGGVPRQFRKPFAPLTGRSDELALLVRHLDRADAGSGSAVCVTGAAGIGKSRLLDEFCLHLAGRDVRYICLRCRPQRRSEAWSVLRQLVARSLGITRADSDAAAAVRIERNLEAAGQRNADAVPLLMHLLDRPAESRAVDGLGPQARRERTHRYLRDLMLTVDDTLVVAIEDVQWLDASSREGIEALLPRIARRRILFVASARAGVENPWARLGLVNQVGLTHLDEAQSLQLLHAAPLASAHAAKFRDIARRAGGNPFFIEALVRCAEAGDVSTPASVEAVVAARMAQLEPGARGVLEAAAAVGASGTLRLLAAACDQDEFEVEHQLSQLEAGELLAAADEGGEAGYEFRHVLVHEVAEARMPAPARVAAHARIADALREHTPGIVARRPERLAHHLEQADAFAEAARFWRRAARMAAERSAFVECAEHAQAGLSCVSRVNDSASTELALRILLAHAFQATHGPASPEAHAQWQRTDALSRDADAASRFQSLLGLVRMHTARSDFDDACERATELLETARRARRSDFVLRAKGLLGETLLRRGQASLARRHLADCERYIDRHGGGDDLSTRGATSLAACMLALLYLREGDRANSARMASLAVDIARESCHPYTLAAALVGVGERHFLDDDVDAARECAHEALNVAEAHSFDDLRSAAQVIDGWGEARSGNAEAGIERIRSGIAAFENTGATMALPGWFGALGDAHRANGELDAARSAAREALERANATRHVFYLDFLHGLDAQLQAAEGRA